MNTCERCKNADFEGINTEKTMCWCWYEYAMILHCEAERHRKIGGCTNFNNLCSKLKT